MPQQSCFTLHAMGWHGGVMHFPRMQACVAVSHWVAQSPQ
jgi:hypothetical protein